MISDEIINYIEYLKEKCFLSVSLHFDMEEAKKIFDFEKFIPYNKHINPYCMSIKKESFKNCLLCQKKVIKKCMYKTSFTGECHAGVKEYIRAIKVHEKAVGFISVSGYKGTKRDKKSPLYETSLSSDMPQKAFLDTVISPLARMTELCFINNYKNDSDEFRKIISFINEYHSSISLDDLCREFHCSKSHISHMFKTKTGQTLKSYCNNLKINDARELLENTSLSVTDVAYTIGFGNLSYFINVFKKSVGMTPLEYKKKM